MTKPPTDAFIKESRTLLSMMESSLLMLQQDKDGMEAVSTACRAAHGIKGIAGIYSYHDVVIFARATESLLDELAMGEIAINENITTLLLESCDFIELLIRVAVNNSARDRESYIVGNSLISQMNREMGIEESLEVTVPVNDDVNNTGVKKSDTDCEVAPLLSANETVSFDHYKKLIADMPEEEVISQLVLMPEPDRTLALQSLASMRGVENEEAMIEELFSGLAAAQKNKIEADFTKQSQATTLKKPESSAHSEDRVAELINLVEQAV